MSQKEIEVILTRQLASYLAMPILIVDEEGDLLFYNEPTEAIIGRRFDKTGEMPREEWAITFKPTDKNGVLVLPEGLPLVIAP